MKLIIDIPKLTYEYLIKIANKGDEPISYLEGIILDGTPLDNIKAEIAEQICLTDNPYTKETKYTIEHLKLLKILDNIGMAESKMLSERKWFI